VRLKGRSYKRKEGGRTTGDSRRSTYSSFPGAALCIPTEKEFASSEKKKMKSLDSLDKEGAISQDQ